MPDGKDIVFFDGGCALCHSTVRFLVQHDHDGSRFSFSPLDGETFRDLMGPGLEGSLPDSVVVRTASGRWLAQSAAVAWLLKRIGGGWRVPGAALTAVPGSVADAVYAVVARSRHRMFGRPAASCPVPEGPLRSRFLP